MKRVRRAMAGLVSIGAAVAAALVGALAGMERTAAQDAPMFDLSRESVLYCVGYAHLDTQWRWDFPTTIDRFIKSTLEDNFALFDKHPGYVFNFTGSVRYEMMKEYYPELYERLKREIAAGKWFVSGSSVDEGDVNVPSPESVIRHVLYGNVFFRREFGKESVDFMLPDCFGFPASMPSIWAHCGLKGFSTQKLTWGSAVGIPFKIGVWEGPDGRGVLAALDPGPYVGAIKGSVDGNEEWMARVAANGERYGVWADYHYYGVGDMGGAPREEDVVNYLASAGKTDAPVRIALTSSDQMYRDITPEMAARLPRYRGDMLLTEHSAGTLTSQSYMKRWNRMAENLGDAAERAMVWGWIIGDVNSARARFGGTGIGGGEEYPRARMERLWVRTLANQMHDILPGTSIPRAYRYSWNDLIVAMNGFASVMQRGVELVAADMDTMVHGTPLVVFNPLAREREDVVEAEVRFGSAATGLEGAPEFVRVFGPDGVETPSQVLSRTENSVRVLFVAKVGPVSTTVFDVRRSEAPFADDGALKIDDAMLENERLRVVIDGNGDVASVVDKGAGGREVLARPARLVFTRERPREYPAWNMDWADRKNPPIGFVEGPARVRVVERGPVRVSLEIEREARGSVFTQRVRLCRGDAGRVVEYDCDIDWQSAECALKASFPITSANPVATYNWGMGTIERGNNEPTKYEVPSHEWLDVMAPDGSHGASILDNSKYGSDKPSDDEVRLTLLYTPGVRKSFLDQHSQDWGRHQITYGLYPHEGDWRAAGSEWRGRQMNQPLRVFQAMRHEGERGRSESLLSVSTSQVDVRAVKMAETRDVVIVRLQELWGREASDVEVRFASPILWAEETDGQERRIGEATVRDGALIVDMTAYSPRTFAVRVAENEESKAAKTLRASMAALRLPFDTDVVSGDRSRADGAMDDEGRTIPAEELPPIVESEGVSFAVGPMRDGAMNAVTCRGQIVEFPALRVLNESIKPNFDHPLRQRLHILMAATEETVGRFEFDAPAGGAVEIPVQSWTGFIGQWDDRVWNREFEEIDFRCEGRVTAITPGFIKRAPVAWFCTHRHHPEKGNEAYRFSYLYRHSVDVPRGARSVRLPENEKIKVLAITVTDGGPPPLRPAAALYDDFEGREPVEFRFAYPEPPAPVFEGATASARARVERAATFGALSVGPPRADDYADAASGREVEFRVFMKNEESAPHRRSGAVNGRLVRLHDGDVARNDDDTARCVWWDGEGRFYADLGAPAIVESITTYSWHRANRAAQWFSVWGSNAERIPDAGIAPGKTDGWTLLAVADTRELGPGGVHASRITGADGESGAVGTYRWLLWVAEDIGEGTFFTEVDIDAREVADGAGGR